MKKMKSFLVLSLTLSMTAAALAGCGNRNSTSGNNSATENSSSNNVGNDLGNAVENVADGVGNAVSDVGNAAGDLLSGRTFNSYSDAHDYFLNQMGSGNTNAAYEVRNEHQDLVNYNDSSQGYRFELYDTSVDTNGTRVGEFYLDPATGEIYQKNETTGAIEKYDATANTSTNETGNNR